MGRICVLHGVARWSLAYALLGACGDLEQTNVSPELGVQSSALRCHDGNGKPITDANCPWRYWDHLLPSSGVDITHGLAPAMCAGVSGFLTVSVDTGGRYRTLQWHAGGHAPSWSLYGNRTFSSKPACALRENVTATRAGFVLAGKATDNKIYTSAGTMAAATSSQQNVTANEMWTSVSDEEYPAGGSPALGFTLGGFGGDGVVLTFMGDDARTVYAHSRHVPYLSNDWSPIITGPVLPSGWTAVGAPAVHALPVTFRIMVHAQSGSTHRLFETYFFLDDGDGYFSTAFASTPAVWTQRPSLGLIEDDPAITFAPGFGTTVYFRRGSEIRQTTESASFHTPLAVKPNEAVEFASAPAATAGVPFDQGTHVVVARTTANQIYFAEAVNDVNLVP